MPERFQRSAYNEMSFKIPPSRKSPLTLAVLKPSWTLL
jgi:hypothetical protein